MVGVRARGRAAALLLIAVGGFVSPPAAAEPTPDAPVTVVWPGMTRFNPDRTPYVIDVDYDGEGTLFVWYGRNDTTVMLDPHGPTRLSFPAMERNWDTRVGVAWCPEPTITWQCPIVSISPEVQPYSDALPGIPLSQEVGPREDIPLFVSPSDGSWNVEWEVVPHDQPSAPPLISGSATGVTDSLTALPALGEGSGLVSGQRYRYRVRLSGDFEPFGPLSGAKETTFVWDAEGPKFELVTGHLTFYNDWSEIDTFYPVEDDGSPNFGYIDTVTLLLRGIDAGEVKKRTFLVTDESGAEVYSETSIWGLSSFEWDGRGAAGDLLPEGVYNISITAYDAHGNATTRDGAIGLSHDRYSETDWRSVLKAADARSGGRVGACGRIKEPARRGWAGSVGLYTSDACRPRGQRFSIATHRVHLPLTPADTVISAELTMEGAMARRERSTSVWFRFWDGSVDRWLPWTKLPGFHSRFEIPVPDGAVSADDPDLTWEARASNGDSYDLRDFIVDLRYSTVD